MSDTLISITELVAAPTRDNVLRYLAQREQLATERGQAPYPAELEFATDAQLEAMEQARDWWPTDAPQTLSFGLALITACNGYAHPTPELQAARLLDGLVPAADRVVTWLESEGRDVSNPNETAKERSARKTRERMKRYRDSRSKHTDPAVAAALAHKRELYAAYLEVCRERREVRDELDERVRLAWAAYQQAEGAAAATSDDPEVPAVPEG